GEWGAGAYTLSDSTTTGGGEGIAAMHVTDGKVDAQINYYTPVDSGAEAPPAETVDDSVVVDYCNAWNDSVDADQVLSYLTDDATLTLLAPIEGKDAIREFIDTSFDFDQNDCDDVAVVHAGWGAAANTFTNSESGLTVSGVNIVRLTDDGQISEHHVHMEAPA
ncbi:MAG: nuclear transport factor 2 family protein, partial [Acidimicrobiales bacterium]|nr:nuclear transport factor 2 family protein [Acidimicrobiales bacterium]